MLKWLSVLLILVSSSASFAAEDIVYNGKAGIFIEAEASKDLLKQLEEELPSLRIQKELLEAKVEKQKEVIDLNNEKMKVQEDIGSMWKRNFEALVKTAEKEDDTMTPYINTIIFAGGMVAGMGIVYATLMILENR